MASERMVYVVTDGDYSDYHIKAVFSTRAKAEAYIAEYNRPPKNSWDAEQDGDEDVVFRHTEGGIEEWPLDRMTGTKGAHVVSIDEDGSVVASMYNPCDWPQDPPHRSGWTRAQMAQPGYQGAGNPLRITGYGKTEEHARRSAEQYRREFLTSEGVRP